MQTRSRQKESFAVIDSFRDCRASLSPSLRLDAIAAQAAKFREQMLNEDPVLYLRSFSISKRVDSLHHGFRDVDLGKQASFLSIERMFIIQFKREGKLRTLLVNPTDPDANHHTAALHRGELSVGSLKKKTLGLGSLGINSVGSGLGEAGIRGEMIDYITYPNLQTQDLRQWLCTAEEPGLLPNCTLLVSKQEWQSAQNLTPPQWDWYCPEGLDGIPLDRVQQLTQDVHLGDGVALIRTPGRTEGNHSIVVRYEEGLMVISGNGVCADSYAPASSRNQALRSYVEDTGMDVVLNGNSMESGLDQYISMIQEREIAGPAPQAGNFYNVVPVCEATRSALTPGLKPSFSFDECEHGRAVLSKKTRL